MEVLESECDLGFSSVSDAFVNFQEIRSWVDMEGCAITGIHDFNMASRKAEEAGVFLFI